MARIGVVLIAAALASASAAAALAGEMRSSLLSGATSDPRVKLGPGDRVQITTFGEKDLSGEFAVAADGTLAFPLIGTVPAAGRTLEEVRVAIATALADGYLRVPRVSAEVLTFRPYYILGEVNKPGEYPYTSGLTIFNAVATAQGFTYRANTHVVMVKHADESNEHKGSLNTAVKVQPGDTIRIVERFF